MKRLENQRSYFAYELYKAMAKDKRIVLITGDLGYGLFNAIREQYPDRFINTGAAEQAMMGIAVGMALEGKIPFVYSITTFLLYRCLETIRNYINHENINVKLIGSGRDKDYEHDGFSHWSDDAWKLLKMGGYGGNNPFFDKIETHWPGSPNEVSEIVREMIGNPNPEFLSLQR